VREGLGQRRFIEDARLMAKAGLMMDVLGPAGMLGDVAKLATEVGGLRIVIDHMPFEPPPEDSALRALEPLQNVWVKVSNVLRRREGALAADTKGLEVLWDVFGPRRLIYGSNWPVSEKVGPYGEVLQVVKEYFGGKGAEASGLVFRENARA
jgi:predicted TIM-barrel fold metal-dependent hydrolase